MPEYAAFDTATSLAPIASALKPAGYSHVLRYLSVMNHRKNLSAAEATALHAAGIQIGVVYESGFPTRPEYFTMAQGEADGHGMYLCAKAAGIPPGKTLGFAIDCDITDPRGCLNYVKAIRSVFATIESDSEHYLLMPYGCGLVCQALLDAGLVHFYWLSGSHGWTGYDAAKDKADILQTTMDAHVLGYSADLDRIRTPEVCW